MPGDRPIISAQIEAVKSTALSEIPHGFMGRAGGVSSGIFEGLNIALGSADDRANVIENRARAAAAILPGAKLARVYQVHSADVVNGVDAISMATVTVEDNPPKADALVTDQPGLLLGISTADCAPVLFADPVAGVIGAAHSGWKGAIGGVNEATITAMEKLGADRSRIICAIGPCIAQKSYEVDASFFRIFCEKDPENERYFLDGKADHYQFDLEGFVASRLAQSGIKTIECLGEDTYSQASRFFSYRRSCHRNEPSYGTQFSLIGLPF
jgi:polyphenol oxidase